MNRIGQDVIGFWGAMHPYDDGVIVGQDEKFLHIQWSESDAVQLVPHTDMMGEWFLDVSVAPRIGIWFANMDDVYIDAGEDIPYDTAVTLAV